MKPIDPRLLRRSRAVRRHLAVAVCLGTATALLVVLQAWLVAWLVASGFDRSGVSGAVTAAVVALGLVFAARSLLGWLHTVAATRAAASVKSSLRRDITASLLRDRDSGSQPESGRVIALLGSGLDALDGYFARYLPQLVLATTVPAVVVAAILWADPLSALTVAVTLPLIVVFMVLVGWMTKEKTERRWGALVRLTHHFVDLLDGLLVLKVFGRSRVQTRGLRRVGEKHRGETMAALRLAFLSSFVLELVASLVVALVAVGIGVRLVDGHLDLRTGLFVLLLAPEAYLPLRQVGTHFHDSAEGLAAADDAFTILDGARRTRDGVAAPDLRGRTIVVEGVGVTYPGRTDAALAPVDLVLEAGRITALTGQSGCGKSTLIDVLMGFIEPTTGRVLVDGTDLAGVDLTSLRQQLAWVPQLPGLLEGTIATNVALGTSDAPDAEIEAALRAAGAEHLSPRRPVREAGANLSAGERRRVALARALLRVRRGDASVMLLDEPTAGLDGDSEERVVAALRESGVTVVVVAHHRRLIAVADDVIELPSAGVSGIDVARGDVVVA